MKNIKKNLKWIYYSALLIGIAWAGFWIFFGIATLMSESFSFEGLKWVLLLTAIVLTSALIPLRWQVIGGVILVIESFIIATGYRIMMTASLKTYVLILLTASLPPLISGLLHLICWKQSKKG